MEKKVIGIWVRVSTVMQVDKESHLHHEIRAKEFVESRGWKIGKIYRLEAMSGKSIMNYEQTKQMLYDIKKGVITGLVFSKIARLARNTKELIEISEIFGQYNADLISMDMSIDTSTPTGRHFFRQMASMAEWEREMTVEKVRDSIKARAELGKYIGGPAPYGYMIKDKRLVPNPDEIPIVKLMFELFLEHKRKRKVANILNDKGYRTRKDTKFTDTTVKRVLKNSVAKGIQIMNHTKNVNNKRVPKPKEEWVFNQIESIVSVELWDKVNYIIDQQYTAYKKNKKQELNTKVHLFTNFAFCSCGGKMRTHAGAISYTCSSGCRNKIRKDDLEEIYRGELYNYTISDKRISEYRSRVEVQLKDKEQQLEKLKKEQEKLELHIEKLLILHTEGKIATEAFHSYHQKPYEQIQQIKQSIITLDNSIIHCNKSQNSAESIIDIAKNLYEKWNDLNHQKKREVIETITEKIIIGDNDIDINLYRILPENEEFRFFESEKNGQHNLMSLQFEQ